MPGGAPSRTGAVDAGREGGGRDASDFFGGVDDAPGVVVGMPGTILKRGQGWRRVGRKVGETKVRIRVRQD